MTTVAAFFRKANRTLSDAGITTARLDALILLADALGKDKSWLLAHPEHELTPQQAEGLETHLAERARRVPLAYIRGTQEFYGRAFTVTSDVLIPRPETEAIIGLLQPHAAQGTLLDVGTGSGAIAVTASLEFPHLIVEACDVSQPALALAEQNNTALNGRVTRFFTSDLLANASGPYTFIVANLPYVDPDWERSPETSAEPGLALFADNDGLALIDWLIAEAPAKLEPHGYLLLEADPRQHAAIQKTAQTHGFSLHISDGFCLCFKRD